MSLVEWLHAHREENHNPRAVATDNLLGALKSALGEMLRTLSRMKGGEVVFRLKGDHGQLF